MEGERFELLGNRIGDLLVAKTEIDVPDRRAAVEILLTVGVPYEHPFAADDDERPLTRVLIKGREARQLVLAIKFVQALGIDLEAHRARAARRFVHCCSHLETL